MGCKAGPDEAGLVGGNMFALPVENSARSLATRQGLRDRLNIIAAAEAHVVWKKRLGSHLRGAANEPLGGALLGQDGVCQLGRLISGAAFAEFQDMEEHRQLRVAHDAFHSCTSAVIEKLNAGDRAGAEAIFENEYSRALHDIIQSLSAINRLLVGEIRM